MEAWQKTISGAVLTTLTWIIATYFTRPTDDETLIKFYQLIKPGGKGWNEVVQRAQAKGIALTQTRSTLPLELTCFVVGCVTVYSALFATGSWIYGRTTAGLILTTIAAIGGFLLFRFWGQLRHE